MRLRNVLRLALRRNWGRVCALWILGLVAIGLQVLAPTMVGRLTDRFTHSSPTLGDLTEPLAWLVVAYAGLAIHAFLEDSTRLELDRRLARFVTGRFVRHVLRLPAPFFRENPVAKIVERAINDTSTAASFYGNLAVGIPVAVLTVIVIAGVLLMENALMAGVIILLSIAQAYYVLFDGRIQRVMREGRDAADGLLATTTEVVSGIDELRHQDALLFADIRFEAALDRRLAALREQGRVRALFAAISPLLDSLQSVVIYAVGAALCTGIGGASNSPMTWGEVIRIAMLAALFQSPIRRLAGFYLQSRLSRQTITRLDEYLEHDTVLDRAEPAPTSPAPQESAPHIAFERVTVHAADGRPILEDVSLEVPFGEHAAVVGPAGCGKSTLLGLTVRDSAPSSGHVRLGDRDVRTLPLRELAATVGYVSQTPTIFAGTVRDNLLVSLRRESEQVLHDAFGALDVRDLGSEIQDEASLDAHLVAVVRAVGLADDLLEKCLDRPVPASWPPDAVREATECVRAAPSYDRDVVPFADGRPLPGTLAENLLGPGADPSAAAREVAGEARTTLVELGRAIHVADSTLVRRGGAPPEGRSRLLALIGSSSPGADSGELPAEELIRVALASDIARVGSFVERLPDWLAELRRAAPFHRSSAPGGLTLRDRLLGGRAPPEARARMEAVLHAALEHAELDQRAILAGLEHPVGERGRLLSGGQRQKLALARTLLRRHPVLVLDEPTSSLDDTSQAQVMNLVTAPGEARTVLAITHRRETLESFDRVICLGRGHILSPVGEGRSGSEALPIESREALARVPIFAGLAAPHLELIARISQVSQYDAGHLLFERGDADTDLYVVLSGAVGFFAEAQRKGSEPLRVARPGRAFGELALFGDGRRTLGARVLRDSSLLRIRKDQLLELIELVPAISVRLLGSVALMMRDNTEEALASSGPPPERFDG